MSRATWYGSHWIRRAKRRAIYNRDEGCCVYCGSAVDLTLDHVQPVAQGGTHDARNLVTSCRSCNRAKSGRTLRAFIPSAERRKRIRNQLRRKLDLVTARTQLRIERDALEEREAIRFADTGVHTFLDEVFAFPFGELETNQEAEHDRQDSDDGVC